MSDPDRYKSRGRKERTPEQLKALEMDREKARLVIAERTKINMSDPDRYKSEGETPNCTLFIVTPPNYQFQY